MKFTTNKEFFDHLRATAIEAVVDTIHAANEKKPTYPEDHRAAMRVPKGGSSCSSCEYLKDREKRLCGQPDYIKWNGSDKIPLPVDEYCSDWYEMKEGIEAGGPGSGRHPWKTGEFTTTDSVFSHPQEEVPKEDVAQRLQDDDDFERANVDLSKLVPTQENLGNDKVNGIVEKFDEKKADPVELIRHDGKLYLWDGHHTAAARIQLGHTKTPARIYNVDDVDEDDDLEAGGPGSGRHPEGYQPPANTQEATDWHNEALKKAKEELGEGASLSAILQRAAEIQKAGKKLEAGGPGSGCNPEVGTCGPHPKLGEQIAPAKGSNPGGVFKGEDGKLRYVKFYPKQSQAAGELVANAVYMGLGLHTPPTQMYEIGGKHVIATDMVEGKQLNQVTLDKEGAKDILKGFAADVLTVNWDAVGLAHDNIIINKNNEAVRIDQGGSFLTRAKGGDKPLEGILGIGEVDKLLNPAINPAYAKVAAAAGVKSWKDIPDFKQQVEKIKEFGEKYPGGWKGYTNVILDSLGGNNVSQDIRNKIGGILESRAKALVELVNKKEEPKAPATPIGKTPKGTAAFKKLVDEQVKQFASTHGAPALGMGPQDYKNWMTRKNSYTTTQTAETPREQLFKSMGFDAKQIDTLYQAMDTWKSHANKETRGAASEILAGKPTSELARLWYAENRITQEILGPGKVKLYRGVTGTHADTLYAASKDPAGAKTLFKILLSSANSWSDSPKVAKGFGKVYLRKNMPTKLILTSYKTNYVFQTRHADEKEFLCMTPEKGVSMKRKNLLTAAAQKVVVIDLRKGKNDAWLHNMRKKTSKKKIKSAIDTSHKGQFEGTLWNGIRIIGFSGPEEEGLRAMLSRIPPELFYNINEFKSAKELGVKHGRFIPETKTILYNPRNFAFRQRFGEGQGWVQHAELTSVHEVGHSIYESLSSEQQQEWWDCSGWTQGWKEGQAPPYVEVRPGWPHMISAWTHRAGAKFTRHYAEKNPNEDFADCFAFFMLGKGFQMEPAKREFLEDFVKDKVKWYPEVNIQSPIAPYPKQEAIRRAASV